MRKNNIPVISSAEITDEAVFMNRREALRLGATAAIGAALAGRYGWQRRQTRKRCKASFVILKIHLISPVS